MRARPIAHSVLLVASVVLTGLAGCGDDTRSCQNACGRAFGSDRCNVQVPGQGQSELINDCIDECEAALRQTGELGNYDPDDRSSVSTQDGDFGFTLQNERQAAVWMDCVLERTCESLDEGFCPGGGIN
jgi:hypothetical protein